MLNPKLQWIAQEFPDLQNLNVLGIGGQKLVLSVLHPTDGEVVLKIIHPSQDAQEIQREILAVEQVGSPRVPVILETGLVDTPMGQSIWIREQRIHGISLRERLQHGALLVDEVLRLSVQMLEALAEAEKVQIVHRDMKPENIMMDANGDFWLLDFGISRHLTMTALTPMTRPFGKFTLGYAPPEQVRNVQHEIDATADLFAFGVTFYECATGKNPFRNGAKDDFEILNRVDSMPLPPLNLSCKDSASLNDLLNAVTQKRRDHRPPTVAEALDWMRDIVKAQTP